MNELNNNPMVSEASALAIDGHNGCRPKVILEEINLEV